MKHIVFTLFIFSIGIASSSFATTNKGSTSSKNTFEEDNWIVKEEVLSYAKQLTFKSKILDESMPINVYLPSNFYDVSDEHRYPVIFINGSHGNKFFHTVTGIVKHMSELDRMPESIVVSLNYSGHFPKVYTNNMGWRRDTIGGYGKPELYLKHLQQELFPYLEKNYRANQYRTIIGISGSALFPIYTATKQPELFQSYILLAAMDVIGMTFGKDTSIMDEITKSFSKKPQTPVLFYMGMADDDVDLKKEYSDIYRKNVSKLESKLNPFKSDTFRFQSEIIANERHYDALVKTLLSALETMYPEKIWAPKYRDLIAKPGDAMANIDAYYEMLSKKIGFTILPNGDRWNSANCLRFIAGKLLRDGRIDESITVASRWLQYEPVSASAHSQLADSLVAKKQLKKALRLSEKAVSIAKENNDYWLKEYEEQLAEIKASIAN